MDLDLKLLTPTSCRVCLLECSVAATNISEVATIFHDLIGYRIDPNDIPQKICLECLEKLTQLKSFKETCNESEKFLAQVRQNPQITEVKTEENFEIKEDVNVEDDEMVELFELEPLKHKKICNKKSKKNSRAFELPMLKTLLEQRCIVKKWEYKLLEDYLLQNSIEPTDFHSFILNYETTQETRLLELSPNEDTETYECEENKMAIRICCTFCRFKGKYLEIKKHLSKEHLDQHMFRCTCKREYACLDMQRFHIAIRHPNSRRVLHGRLQCNFCLFSCSYETTMERHCMKMHQNKLSELELCVECGEQLFCDYLKLQHIVFRCNAGDKSIQIPFRSIFGQNISMISSKKDMKEKNVKEVICELCGKEVPKRYLETHVRQSHKNIRYECDICGNKYKERTSLVKHIKGKHLNLLNYPCQFCERNFKDWSTRYIHTKVNHSTEPHPFVCDICGKRYFKKSQLKNHRDTHSDIRKFPCPQCDLSFKSRIHLSSHRNNVHSNKTLECQICHKIFTSKQTLRNHKLTHEPNKYHCPVCPDNFSVNQSLRRHIEGKHPEYDLPPPGTIMITKK